MKHTNKFASLSLPSACALFAGLACLLPGSPSAQGGDPGSASHALTKPSVEASSSSIVWSVNPYASHKLAPSLLPGNDGALLQTDPQQEVEPLNQTSGYSLGLNWTALPSQGPWSINGRIAYSVNPDRSDVRDQVADNVFNHISSTLAAGYAFHDWEPYMSLTVDKKVSSDDSAQYGMSPRGANVAMGARFDFSDYLTGEVATSRSLLMRNQGQIEERNILGNIRLAF
ncbi:MAG: hypothetical protein HQL63_09645 [Magnetococcales bacterium]|nr:hypothetical protein [Magnetococcales bacterium]MBF0322172.1 hypothetical protein [Magnetococcales bacterium]